MATKTFLELHAELGPADPNLAAILFATDDPDVFGRRGAQIASGKVLVDARRLIPQAAHRWSKASPAQQKLLRGVSPAALAVYVAEALELERLEAELSSGANADTGTRRSGTEELDAAHQGAMEVRDTAVAALTTLAGRDDARLTAITNAVGTSDTEEDLAQSLERVAALVKSWAADPVLAAAAAALQVDAGLTDELASAAAVLRAADAEAGRRMTVTVTQADLDHQDGRVLHALMTLIRVFDSANARDRRIRRLVPLATRRFFGLPTGGGDDLDAADDELPPEPEPQA